MSPYLFSASVDQGAGRRNSLYTLSKPSPEKNSFLVQQFCRRFPLRWNGFRRNVIPAAVRWRFLLWWGFLLRVNLMKKTTGVSFSRSFRAMVVFFVCTLLAGCHLSTESPIQIQPESVQVTNKDGMAFILVPLDVLDKGSRTLRVHLRHSLIDLETTDKRNYRLRGSESSDFILHHSDKKYSDVYPPLWKESWTDRAMAHKDAVIPAETRKFVPLLFLYRGTLPDLKSITLHLVYSYPQTATNDELILDLPIPTTGSP